jgi:hypothetical protein
MEGMKEAHELPRPTLPKGEHGVFTWKEIEPHRTRESCYLVADGRYLRTHSVPFPCVFLTLVSQQRVRRDRLAGAPPGWISMVCTLPSFSCALTRSQSAQTRWGPGQHR